MGPTQAESGWTWSDSPFQQAYTHSMLLAVLVDFLPHWPADQGDVVPRILSGGR